MKQTIVYKTINLMLKRILIVFTTAYLLAITVAPVQAADYEVGAGFGVKPDYEGSSDYKGTFIPFGMVALENGMWVQLAGVKLTANLVPKNWVPWLRLGPVYNHRDPRSDVDNSRVDNLKDVSDANELGGFVGFDYKGWFGSLSYLMDMGAAHDGEYAKLSGGYNWKYSEAWFFNFGAHTIWADSNYMDTYFGVDANDAARSGLSQYKADSGIYNVGIDLVANWRFANSWSLRGLLSISQLIGDADESSPVVDEGSELQLFTGALIIYTF